MNYKLMVCELLNRLQYHIEYGFDKTFMRVLSAMLYDLAKLAEKRSNELPDAVVREVPNDADVDIEGLGVVTEVIQ